MIHITSNPHPPTDTTLTQSHNKEVRTTMAIIISFRCEVLQSFQCNTVKDLWNINSEGVTLPFNLKITIHDYVSQKSSILKLIIHQHFPKIHKEAKKRNFSLNGYEIKTNFIDIRCLIIFVSPLIVKDILYPFQPLHSYPLPWKTIPFQTYYCDSWLYPLIPIRHAS